MRKKTKPQAKKKSTKEFKFKKVDIALTITTIIISLFFNIINYTSSQKQIRNSIKQNDTNNTFQIATKSTEDRVSLNQGFGTYDQGQLLLSPAGSNPSLQDKNSSLLYIENTSKNIAQNVVVLAKYNSRISCEYFLVPTLQPGQRIYFYNPNNSDLSGIQMQCSSTSGEILQFFYITQGMLSDIDRLSLYSNKIYFDKKIYINDLNNLTNEPQNDSPVIRSYNDHYYDMYKEYYLKNNNYQNQLCSQYQL